MLPIIILVISVPSCLIFTISAVTRRKRNDSYTVQGWLAAITGIIAVALLIIWPGVYGDSLTTMAELKAFLDATKSSYEYAITATQEVEIKAIKESGSSAQQSTGLQLAIPQQLFNAGELAYLKQGLTVSERIKELRDKVEWYNKTIEKYKRLNHFWITEALIVDIPEDMAFIVFK